MTTALGFDGMTAKLKKAAFVATAASMITLLVGADGSSAFAQELAAEILPVTKAEEPTEIRPQDGQEADQTAAVEFVSGEVVQDIPEDYEEEQAPVATDAASLRELVALQPQPRELSREMQCLAGAIYFESRGEPLAGQLAVGRVIVGRAKSGRFPNSYCGVVYQRSQFSFVRGGRMPAIRYGTQAWRNAVALAQIAHEGTWKSEVDGALFFHANYVNPRWRLTRIAQIGNHIFYR